MTMSQFFGVLLVLGLAAFIAFAFRQGLRVKPDDREDRSAAVQPDDLRPPH